MLLSIENSIISIRIAWKVMEASFLFDLTSFLSFTV